MHRNPPPPPSGFVSGEAKLLPNIMSEETGSLRTSVMESQKLASSRARLEPRCIWHPSTAWKLHLAGIKPVLPGKQVATPPDICVCCPSTSVSFYTHLLQKWKPRPSKSWSSRNPLWNFKRSTTKKWKTWLKDTTRKPLTLSKNTLQNIMRFRTTTWEGGQLWKRQPKRIVRKSKLSEYFWFVS